MVRQETIPYEEVFRALNKAQVNYLVCEGVAVVMLGFARLFIFLKKPRLIKDCFGLKKPLISGS